MEEKRLECPLVAGCNKGKSYLLHVSRWDKLKSQQTDGFLLGCSSHTCVCPRVSDKFGFYLMLWGKMWWLTAETDSWLVKPGRDHAPTDQSPDHHYTDSAAARICDGLASCLDTGRKWSHVVHLYSQSIDKPQISVWPVLTRTTFLKINSLSSLYRTCWVSHCVLPVRLDESPVAFFQPLSQTSLNSAIYQRLEGTWLHPGALMLNNHDG